MSRISHSKNHAGCMFLTLRMFEGLGDMFADSGNYQSDFQSCRPAVLLYQQLKTTHSSVIFFLLPSHYGWIKLGLKGKTQRRLLIHFFILLRMETTYTLCLRTVMGIPYPLLFWNTTLQTMCL